MTPTSTDFEDDDASETDYYKTFRTEIRTGKELPTNEND